MIAIVTSHPIQYQAPLWRDLAQDGRVPFEVWFLTPHAVQPSRDREFGTTFSWDVDLLAGYSHRFLEIKPEWSLSRFDGIHVVTPWVELLRRHNVTALWIEGWRFRTLWQAVRAAHALGIPVWLRGESNDLAPEPWTKRVWKRFALQWYFSRVNRFLCIGSANRRFYRRFGIAEDRLVAAPYCVDNERFAAMAEKLRPERDRIRAGWNIAPEARCVLFCAKLIPKKRPFDLFDASRVVRNVDGAPLHLLWVGDGELGASLRIAATKENAPQSTFTGFLNQSEVPRAFVAADCLVLPSDYGETWGLVVNEALASGLPAIVSDRCGCAEDIGRPQGAAHVFSCADVNALANAITHVLRCPPAAKRLAEIIATHSPGQTVETVVSIAN